MKDNGQIEVMHEICDVLEALILMAKLDHAPVRAVALLERAEAETRACLEQLEPSTAE